MSWITDCALWEGAVSPVPPFDPATDMTNLDLWFNAESGNITVVGSDVTSIDNLGGLGGTFASIDGTVDDPVVGPTVNGHPSITAATASVCSWSGGRWLSDDIYDIYVVIKAPAQQNKTVCAQHRAVADSGRIVWGTETSGAPYDKARIFFNNGSSQTGDSGASPFQDTWEVVRWHSSGSGDHYIQVNDATDTLAITGQTVTPFNTAFRLFGVGAGGGGGAASDMLDGDVAEFFGCSSVQANSSDVFAYLMTKYGIT